MVETIVPTENILIIDSMPSEVCKISRSKRLSICKETYETSPYKGFCPVPKSYSMVTNYMAFAHLTVFLPPLI